MSKRLIGRVLKKYLTPLLFVLSVSSLSFAVQAEKLKVNFRESDIRAVIESVAEITGRSFILDPRVQGKITIISPQSLDSDMLYDVILSALQVHGFQAVEDGPVTRIVPFTQSFQLPGGAGDNRIVTAVLATNYVRASELLPSLKPMLSKGALIQAHDASNNLIVTDTRAQIARISKVIADVDNPAQQAVEIIQLENISAGEALHIAGQLTPFQSDKLNIVEDIHNNRLIISGNPVARHDLKTVIASLDIPTDSGGGMAVIRLQYAQAEPMRLLLENIMQSSLLRPQQPADSQSGEKTYKIAADTSSNALVISAAAGIISELKQVVRYLDVPRRQVLIEAVVAELSENQAKRLSVQLAAAGREGGAIINFNQLLPALVGLSLDEDITAEDLAGLPLGDGFTGGGLGWDDDKKQGIGLLVEALRNDADTNILSTPSVVTLENEEAAISVGQEVPFITGSFISNNNTVDNPFQTIDREEIGVKLRVTPQINEGGVVRMSIEQETSNLLGNAATTGAADIITAKRIITTNVMVGNGEFLVLGGLIDESFAHEQSKVPLLGDLPVLGHLFRSRSKNSSQSVLMVFIRPTILDKAATSRQATDRQYNYLRHRQLNFRDRYKKDSPLAPLPKNIEDINSDGLSKLPGQ